MQFPPSTVSSDNNLFALLFPAASAAAGAGTAAATLPEPGQETFADLFAALTPTATPGVAAEPGVTVNAPAFAACLGGPAPTTSTLPVGIAQTAAEIFPSGSEPEVVAPGSTPSVVPEPTKGKPTRPPVERATKQATPCREAEAAAAALAVSGQPVDATLPCAVLPALETPVTGESDRGGIEGKTTGLTRAEERRPEWAGGPQSLPRPVSRGSNQGVPPAHAGWGIPADGTSHPDHPPAAAHREVPERPGVEVAADWTQTEPTPAFVGAAGMPAAVPVQFESQLAEVAPEFEPSRELSHSTPPVPDAAGSEVEAFPLEAGTPEHVAMANRWIPLVQPTTVTAGRPTAADRTSDRAPVMAEEKFADLAVDAGAEDIRPGLKKDKISLTTEEKVLAKQPPTVGTSVANPEPAMSNRVATPLPMHPVSEYTDGAVALAQGAAEQLGEAAAAPAVSDAHRAVEVVLHAVDRVAGREQSTVKLEFSVGDAELVVRVERHANEVRATFRTDSAELRTALAQEWQAVTGAASDRAGRASSATFAGLEQLPQESLSGDASSSRQHERQPARNHDHPVPVPSFARASSVGAPAAPSFASAHPAAPLAPAGTAQRLNLFA